MRVDQTLVQAEELQHKLAGVDRKFTEEEQSLVGTFLETRRDWLARREDAQRTLNDLKREVASLLQEAIRMDFGFYGSPPRRN